MRYTLTTPRDGWLRNGLLAGLVATGGMTIALVAAYVFADGVGDPRGGAVARWLWALAHNRVTEAVGGGPLLFIGLQLSVGLALSALYAGAAEPALPGPGWARGIVFALGPWVLSLVLFLPLVGGGLFGRALGAGPLPALGNLIVHLIYGAILGAVYAIPESAGLARTPEDLAANVRADRGAAIGIVAGAAVGALIGALIQAVGGSNPLLPAGGLILGGALIGGGWGGVVGSLAGLTPATKKGKAR